MQPRLWILTCTLLLSFCTSVSSTELKINVKELCSYFLALYTFKLSKHPNRDQISNDPTTQLGLFQEAHFWTIQIICKQPRKTCHQDVDALIITFFWICMDARTMFYVSTPYYKLQGCADGFSTWHWVWGYLLGGSPAVVHSTLNTNNTSDKSAKLNPLLRALLTVCIMKMH